MISYNDLVKEFGFDVWTHLDKVHGKIGSAMPKWYFPEHLAEEERILEDQENQLKRGGQDLSYHSEIAATVRKERTMVESVKHSLPRPEGVKKDKLYAVIKELGEMIGESLFSHTDMQTGKNPHEEAKRNWDKIIQVKNNVVAKWILLCNGRLEGERNPFKVSRNDAIRSWKMGRFILEIPTDVEELRPEETIARSRIDSPYYKRPSDTVISISEDKKEVEIEQDITFSQIEEAEEPEAIKTVKKERVPCVECGGSMVGEPGLAKRCKACREIRDGRKNADTDSSGDS